MTGHGKRLRWIFIPSEPCYSFSLFFYSSQHNTIDKVFLQERIYHQHWNHRDEYLCRIQRLIGQLVHFLDLIHRKICCLNINNHLFNVSL